MIEFDLQKMYDDMSLRKKITLFLKQNHFLFWKVTLMDVTIVVPLFALLVLALDKRTTLSAGYVLLISAGICSIIEFFRIRYRRVKTYRYLAEKAGYINEIMVRYEELVKRSGDKEQMEAFERTKETMEAMNGFVTEMADLVYQEDVLGLSEDDEEKL